MTGIQAFRFDLDGKIIEHDLQLDDEGNLSIISGLDEVKERVASRMLLLRGEDIFDRSKGLPLRGDILSRSVSQGIAGTLITSEILTLSDVREVRDVEIEIDDRVLKYRAGRIETDYGQTTIEVG